MTNRSETFGRLLKGAINSIAAYEGKTAPAIEEELGSQIGVTGGSIQRYKAGYLPPEPRTIAVFAEAGVRRGFLARAWLVRFLQAARYPTPETLVAQLADALGAPVAAIQDGLPTGTVTLLFTDIAGSTERWEAQPHAMERALERHDAILRQAIDAYGGQVFKTVGDAFYAVFTTVSAALEATLSAQRSLHAESWGPIGTLAVRMALHVGAPQQRDGDYFGPPLNRLARILSAGHGGQVLLSLSAQELVRDLLPPGVGLRDLGEHRLKDLGRPERIYQVNVPELPANFPPLRTLDTYRHNLPPQATPLIGREAEVERVRELLAREEARLLTLTGPGGIGKTRLALQAGAELLDDYRDGVIFVALEPVRDPAHVPVALAHALKLREAADLPLVEQLKHALRSRQALLVLDNFEQVLAAAPVIGELLAAAPQLKALVTSREALHLYGEQEYGVPPLALPEPGRIMPIERLAQIEAVRLFIERAQAVRPDFVVTVETAPIIAEICAQLDGLPLAIELAAARSKLFPPKALLARLDRRLRMLTGGPRDLPARQQTLAGAIAWSFDLLDPTEQTVFARLGVFAGGCTLELAETVLGDDNAADEVAAYVPTDVVLNSISALVDRSLLRQVTGAEDEPRFVMLETIREYALERLGISGEEEVIRARHARCFYSLAREAEQALAGPQQNDWLLRLTGELDNIRASLGWAVAHDIEGGLSMTSALRSFWNLHIPLQEGISWLSRFIQSAANIPAAVRARGLLTLGGMYIDHHQFDQSRKLSEQALELYRELDDQDGIAWSLGLQGTVLCFQGSPQRGLILINESISLFRVLGNTLGTAQMLSMLATGYESDYQRAHALLEESFGLFQEQGHIAGMIHQLNDLSMLALRHSDYAIAETYLNQALALQRELAGSEKIFNTLNTLGELALRQRNYEQARSYFQESAAIYQASGQVMESLWALIKLGGVSIQQKKYTEAAAYFTQVLPHFKAAGDTIGVVCALEGIASLAVANGQFEQGLRLFTWADVTREAIRDTRPAIEQIDVDRDITIILAHLDEARIAVVRATGQALTLEQAIAEALTEVVV